MRRGGGGGQGINPKQFDNAKGEKLLNLKKKKCIRCIFLDSTGRQSCSIYFSTKNICVAKIGGGGVYAPYASPPPGSGPVLACVSSNISYVCLWEQPSFLRFFYLTIQSWCIDFTAFFLPCESIKSVWTSILTTAWNILWMIFNWMVRGAKFLHCHCAIQFLESYLC